MKKIILMTFIITMLTINIAFGIAIVDAACGNNHTVLLAEDGTVWTMGDNTYGQCGHDLENTKITKPTQILYIPKMIKVAATGDATMLLDEDGNAYLIDANGLLEPCGIDNVVDIAMAGGASCTENTSNGYAVLTEEGNVYTMGYGGAQSGSRYYRYLGRSLTGYTSSWGLARVSGTETLPNIKEIFMSFGCGLCCIDEDGYLYSYYQGTSDTTYMVKGNQLTLDISKQLSRNKFYFNEGYSSGGVYSGWVECGYKYSENTIEIIKSKVGKEIKVEDILCIASNGHTSSDSYSSDSPYSYHIPRRGAMVTSDGSVYDIYKIGAYSYACIDENYNISSKKIVKAAVGSKHTILIDEDGNVYSYGDNTYGQLGLRDKEDLEVGVLETASLGINTQYGNNYSDLAVTWAALLKKGSILHPIYFTTSGGDPIHYFDLNDYFTSSSVEVNRPTLIESLQEIVPNEQSSLAYMTSDARVWIGGIANFSLMFEVNEDMTLRNTGNNLQDIFTNGALNLKVYEVYNNGAQVLIPTAQGQVYNIYEDGVNITQSITPNFVFKSGKVYQLECGIGGDGVFMDRYGETRNYYTVKFEGMNASKVKDGVVTQMRSSVDIAKFILRVYVTELANLT